MRFKRCSGLASALLLVAACSAPDSPPAADAPLETDDAKASYAIGLNLGGQLQPAADRLDMGALRRGLEDALAERDPALPQQELGRALQAFSQSVQAEEEEQRAAEGRENVEAGEAYMAENAEREGVQTTESGLQYEVLEEGDGPRPGPEDQVTVHYRGTLIDGTEFDSSYERGEPATFGVGGVIPGFAEGLQLMPVGSTYRFVIPSDLAYGEQGAAGGTIGPSETLIFEVELIEIL